MLVRCGMQQDQPDEGKITTACTGAAVRACSEIKAHWPPPSDARRYMARKQHMPALNKISIAKYGRI